MSETIAATVLGLHPSSLSLEQYLLYFFDDC